MLSDLLLDLVIHVKCTNNTAQHRNTYLKCNRLKFTLNRARRALIQPRRRTGNGSTVEPLMRHGWIIEYSGKPNWWHPPPSPNDRNSPRQELKCLSFYLITRPLGGENGGDQRSTDGATQGWWRERSLFCFWFFCRPARAEVWNPLLFCQLTHFTVLEKHLCHWHIPGSIIYK